MSGHNASTCGGAGECRHCAAADEHDPSSLYDRKVKHVVAIEEPFLGPRVWVATCTCGWRGPSASTFTGAYRDGTAHREQFEEVEFVDRLVGAKLHGLCECGANRYELLDGRLICAGCRKVTR